MKGGDEAQFYKGKLIQKGSVINHVNEYHLLTDGRKYVYNKFSAGVDLWVSSKVV
jgi:hypothetical protein